MIGIGLIETSKFLFFQNFPSLARFTQTTLSLIPCCILSYLRNEMKTYFLGKSMPRNSKFLEQSTMQLAVSQHRCVASSASLSSGVHIGNYKKLLSLWDRTTQRFQILAFQVCVCAFTAVLTPCSTVLPVKLTCSQLVKKFPTFQGTRRFITAFTCARHLSLSQARSIQSMPPHPTSLSSILILSSHRRLGLPSGLFRVYSNTWVISIFLQSYFTDVKLFASFHIFFKFLARQPPVDQGLLSQEVSKSHTTTHHSRQDSSGQVISSSQKPLTTHNTTDRCPCTRWDSKPQPQKASCRRPTPQTARPLGPARRSIQYPIYSWDVVQNVEYCPKECFLPDGNSICMRLMGAILNSESACAAKCSVFSLSWQSFCHT